MHAMILAAGRGKRMRPLTDHTPKPLLRIGGRSIIEYQLAALAEAGFNSVVINHAHLGEQLVQTLGDGSRYDLQIHYSAEEQALETGGGILRALPMLGAAPFLVINGDLWSDYPYKRLMDVSIQSAHLVLVNNPAHHPHGDFVLQHGRISARGGARLTFSGIGVYHPKLFSDCRPGPFPLAPLLRRAMAMGEVSGEHYGGEWFDVGTPERLAQLDALLTQK